MLRHGVGGGPGARLSELSRERCPDAGATTYRIACDAGGHYLDNLCRSWSDALDNFHYEPITGALDEKAAQAPLRHHPQLGDCDVYVAGPGPWVNAAEFQLLEHGLPRTQLTVSAMET